MTSYLIVIVMFAQGGQRGGEKNGTCAIQLVMFDSIYLFGILATRQHIFTQKESRHSERHWC